MSDRSDEIKGGLKAGLGKVTGNIRLETAGRVQQTSGRLRRQVRGALKGAFGRGKRAVDELLGSPDVESASQPARGRGQAEQI
jgi:uncharacterized protein YjbJ (UPF0337 family)